MSQIEQQDEENYDTVYVELTTTENKKVTVATFYKPPKQQPVNAAALYKEIQSNIQKINRSAYWGLQLPQC